MVEKDILSQEEIDALLESVDNTADAENLPPDEAAPITSEDPLKAINTENEQPAEIQEEIISGGAVHKDKVILINFTRQSALVRGQMPVLEKIYDRAVRLFVTDIYNLTATDFEIKQEPLAVIKNRDFMGGLPNPSLIRIYKFMPLRGKGIILFDSTFVFDLVDYYFGGSTLFYAQKDKSDYTATELGVMDLVFKKLVHNLTQAWQPIMDLEIVKFNQETNPQLVNIAEPDEMLMVARFSLNFGKESGSFYFIIPYSMVEPIKQQLDLGASRPDDEIDPNWIKMLKEELMDVELTISSTLPQTIGSLREVMAWQVGDFIPFEMNEEVIVDIEGTPSFKATLGSADDKRALKITKTITY